MLFTFNKFWKSLLLLIGAWSLWAVVGYEFTTVTLLALLIAANFESNSSVF
tara:strand:+ start:2324 stop:2476 length:153 start_codon:yes stop_codon:yes gene_type:complete